MCKLKDWLAQHKISAHSLAGAWVFLTGLWATNQAFRDYVYGLYAQTPKFVHEFIAGVIVPALIFWKSQRSDSNV